MNFGQILHTANQQTTAFAVSDIEKEKESVIEKRFIIKLTNDTF